MRSISIPRAATSVATTISKLPLRKRSRVCSRNCCVISPLSAAERKPFFSSSSVMSKVPVLVRAKIIAASKSSTSKKRRRASFLRTPCTYQQLWSISGAFSLLTLIFTSFGSFIKRFVIRRIGSGIVAENNAVW